TSASVSEPASAAAVVVGRRDKSALARAFDDHHFVAVVDIRAPRGLDLAATTGQARRFRDGGAVAVSVPDYPRSGARASALALAALVERAGVETLLHCPCRDRTLIGLQADLVGAHAMGIRNVLLTTGSPARAGNYPEHTSVFEVDAIGLINLATRLNHGQDMAGQALGASTAFHIGATFNPFPADDDAEWDRLTRKIEAGAEFLVTPPVLDLEAFEPVLRRLRSLGLPVLAGVAMLESARQAEVLSSEVVGVRASDAVLARLREAGDQGAEAGRVTVEIIEWLRERADGLVCTWLHGTSDTAERVLDAVRPHLRGLASAPSEGKSA
ncbi:MAG: methylenetetrahydrofolate reductase, partial [Acidobacteriota bacterium]